MVISGTYRAFLLWRPCFNTNLQIEFSNRNFSSLIFTAFCTHFFTRFGAHQLQNFLIYTIAVFKIMTLFSFFFTFWQTLKFRVKKIDICWHRRFLRVAFLVAFEKKWSNFTKKSLILFGNFINVCSM